MAGEFPGYIPEGEQSSSWIREEIIKGLDGEGTMPLMSFARRESPSVEDRRILSKIAEQAETMSTDEFFKQFLIEGEDGIDPSAVVYLTLMLDVLKGTGWRVRSSDSIELGTTYPTQVLNILWKIVPGDKRIDLGNSVVSRLKKIADIFSWTWKNKEFGEILFDDDQTSLHPFYYREGSRDGLVTPQTGFSLFLRGLKKINEKHGFGMDGKLEGDSISRGGGPRMRLFEVGVNGPN